MLYISSIIILHTISRKIVTCFKLIKIVYITDFRYGIKFPLSDAELGVEQAILATQNIFR